MTSEFELSQQLLDTINNLEPETRHHKANKSLQKRFVSHVNALTATIEEKGNPFTDTSKDLVQLDTRIIANNQVITTLRVIEMVGKEQYCSFVETRLEKRTVPFSDPIKKKNPLFSLDPTKTKNMSNVKQTIVSLKKSCSLFSKMYISCQVRNDDMK